MKVITRTEIVSDITDFNEEILPYFFSSGYELFSTRLNNDKYSLFYSESVNALMPVRSYVVKTFTLLQIIYPPITIAGERLSEKNEKQFLEEFVELVKRQKLGARITQSYSYAVFKSVPNSSISCPFGTYWLDLKNHTEDELFERIDPKGRNKIRNAQKNGVVLKWDNRLIDDFYLLYKDTME